MEENLMSPNEKESGGHESEPLSPDAYLEEIFQIQKRDYTQYSPLTLAYLGDGVYDLVIRTIAVKRANRQAAKLNKEVTGLVKAMTQAKIARAIEKHLTEEEAALMRRGKNAKPYNTAKNATRQEYLVATGFEALMGYLYLQGRHQRLMDLIKLGLKETGHEI